VTSDPGLVPEILEIFHGKQAAKHVLGVFTSGVFRVALKSQFKKSLDPPNAFKRSRILDAMMSDI
jgi:hypothetical protein